LKRIYTKGKGGTDRIIACLILSSAVYTDEGVI